MVRYIEGRKQMVSDDNIFNDAFHATEEPPRETLYGEPLARITTVQPNNVAELRDFFDETWEADVFFTNRFLIESGIKRGFEIPAGKSRVSFDEINPIEPPDVKPRMVCVDIEVYTGGIFPEPEDADMPVTAVTAYDTYDEEYVVYALHPSAVDTDSERTAAIEDHDWPTYEVLQEAQENGRQLWSVPDGVDTENVEMKVFDREAYLLGELNEWIAEKDPDLLTGWNSSRNDKGSGFDYPYIINRCQNISESTYTKLSNTGTCFVSDRGAPVVGGREMFDMLQAYKKTQIHEKESYALDAIAEEELGYGKEDVAGGLDHGWLHEPDDFMRYNIRDVEAVIEIEKSKGVLDMYDHIRSIAGPTYSECADSNIGIIDILYLRRAKEQSLALPTSTVPDRGWYYGAKVIDPVPGKHENVVYPDLASLYPYGMWSLNVSPETLYESLDEAREDGYSEDDLYSAYIDYRDDAEKKDSEPELTEVYYVKPDCKEGFVRSVITELTDMKYEYKGDEYPDEAYDAVKRIVNSVYGVFGDSSSYGKGFRLFDWRLAETITIFGRIVLDYTANQFTEYLQEHGYPDAELIGGDTDSCMTTIRGAESQDDALDAAFRAAEYVNDSYDEFVSEEFDIDDPEMHKTEVEVESYAEALFFQSDFKGGERSKGTKKRYAQLITWDEGDYIEDPDVVSKGFELVRSDSSQVTKRVQENVLGIVLREDDAREHVREYVKKEWDSVLDGDVALEDIGKPSAINNKLWDYGWSVSAADADDDIVSVEGERLDAGDEYVNFFTPQPHIRGARYATEYVEGETPKEGSKPLFFYLDGVDANADLPETFDYDHCSLNAPESKSYKKERQIWELDRPVDAIAVEDVRNMPDAANVDWEKLANKNIRDPVEPITWTMGWDFDELVSDSAQSGLADFM
jgi:DNA polymerase I